MRARIYRTSASNEIVHNEVGLQSVHVSEPAAAPGSNGRNSLQDPAAVPSVAAALLGVFLTLRF
jgi:hypothetical protein